VDIDLGLSVFANSRKYYHQKKQAAIKAQKTSEASYKVHQQYSHVFLTTKVNYEF
jgi:hypothetical protein